METEKWASQVLMPDDDGPTIPPAVVLPRRAAPVRMPVMPPPRAKPVRRPAAAALVPAPAQPPSPVWEQRIPSAFAEEVCKVCQVSDARPKVFSAKHKGPVHQHCVGTSAPCVDPQCCTPVQKPSIACAKHAVVSPTICVFCDRSEGADKVYFQSVHEPCAGVAHLSCLERRDKERRAQMRGVANDNRSASGEAVRGEA